MRDQPVIDAPAVGRGHTTARVGPTQPSRRCRASVSNAIRYAPAAAAEGTLLFAEAMQPVCSPALLRAAGVQGAPPWRTPDDLRHYTLLRLQPTPQVGMPLE